MMYGLAFLGGMVFELLLMVAYHELWKTQGQKSHDGDSYGPAT